MRYIIYASTLENNIERRLYVKKLLANGSLVFSGYKAECPSFDHQTATESALLLNTQRNDYDYLIEAIDNWPNPAHDMANFITVLKAI